MHELILLFKFHFLWKRKTFLLSNSDHSPRSDNKWLLLVISYFANASHGRIPTQASSVKNLFRVTIGDVSPSLTNELAAGARKSLIGSKKKTNNLSKDILNSRSSSRRSKWIGTGKNGNCGKLFAFSPFCALFDRRKRKAQGRRSVEIEMWARMRLDSIIIADQWSKVLSRRKTFPLKNLF